jgi:hypothetical protein
MNEAQIMRKYGQESPAQLHQRKNELLEQERPLSDGQRKYRRRIDSALRAKAPLPEQDHDWINRFSKGFRLGEEAGEAGIGNLSSYVRDPVEHEGYEQGYAKGNAKFLRKGAQKSGRSGRGQSELVQSNGEQETIRNGDVDSPAYQQGFNDGIEGHESEADQMDGPDRARYERGYAVGKSRQAGAARRFQW